MCSENFIELGADKYNMEQNQEGQVSIKRYNPKYKMWVKINFANEISDNKTEEFIIEMLSKQIIDGAT